MKKHLIHLGVILLIISVFIPACEKKDTAYDVPSCIENKIKEIEKEEVRNPPAQVWRWEENGDVYYYITSDCCDQYNFLYDEDCNVVCAPDGGFTGNGDGNCPNFSSNTVKTLVWKDNR